MRCWTWKDMGIRPLVFPVLALGLGCALPPPGPGVRLLGCLAAGLAMRVASRARPGAHLALLGAAVLAGSTLAGCGPGRSIPSPRARPVLLEGRLGPVEVDDAGRPGGPRGRAGRRRLRPARGPGSGGATPPCTLGPVSASSSAPSSAPTRDPTSGDSSTPAPRGGRAGSRPRAGCCPARSCLSRRRRHGAPDRRAARGVRPVDAGAAGDADAAALVGALAAGLRSELGPGWEDRFARSGLAHVLSVSGLHVAALALVLAALLGALLRAFPALVRRIDPRRPAAVAALPVVWAYVVFTGTQPPAVRSALMLSLVLAGRALQRHTDGLNALALAAGLLLVVDPASVHDLSLQLSFSAVLALILLAPRLRAWVPMPLPDPARPPGWRRARERLREALLGVCTASAAVTLASVPLVAGAFHRVSIVGWAVNVVALPVASVLTLACAITAGAFCLSPALAALPLLVASSAARGLLALVRVGAAVPFGVLPSPSFSWPAALAFALGLLGVALGVRRAGWLVVASTLAVLGGPAPRAAAATRAHRAPGRPWRRAPRLLGRRAPPRRWGRRAGRHRPRRAGGGPLPPRARHPAARGGGPVAPTPGPRARPAHRPPRGAHRAALAPGRHRAGPARRRRPRRRRRGAGRVARRRRRPPPGRGGGARAVTSGRRPRAPDGE